MPESPNSLIQQCPACGGLIDAAGEEPFALMHCPACGEAMRVRRNFDHFELQVQLGAGGMGTVYRALDRHLNRQVALKLLHKEQSANPEFIAQFEKEAAITASITHPHVVKVFSTGQDNGLVYIAMELVDQGSLDDLLQLEEPADEARILTTGIQIAEGLNAALKRGLIHRDVKPGNILFANATTAKIVDFGLAVLAEHAGTVMGEVWGTPAYVAPEKLDGRPEDLRSDIYSLGATLYHALAGVPPCDVETDQMRVLLAAKRKEPSLATAAPALSPTTAYAIDKTLKFNPAERFQTYEELVGALDYARAEVLAAAEAAARAPKKNLNLITYAVIAAVVVLGAVGVAFKLHTPPAPATPPPVVEETSRGVGIDGKYQAARLLLAGGEWQKAADAFRALEASPNVPQPRLNWITLHTGLAEFLAGRVPEGRAAFAKLEARGPFSTDPTEQHLADFFVAAAKLAATEQPVPATVGETFDLEAEAAVALLVFAAKDWALQDYPDAGPLFRQFGGLALPPGATWVADYQALARPRATDCATYLAATRAVQGADTPEQRETALHAVEAARGKLTELGDLPTRLDTMAADLRAKIAQDKSAQAEKMAAIEAADAAALADMKTKLQTLCAQFKYPEAHLAAKALAPQSENGRQMANIMVRKTEWLALFKTTLIADLTALGYPAPLVKKNNLQLPGGVHRADETQVAVASQFGSLLVPWTDLSPDCVFAMGQSFLHASYPPDKLADRAWYLGVYAYFTGKETQGKELLLQAVQAKEEYREHLPLFLTPAEMP